MAVKGSCEHVTLEELAALPTPSATATWHPVPHSRVMDMVLTTLDMMRFKVNTMDLAVAREGGQFFGTLDLATDITDGVTLAVGIRNSVDQSFALSFCCGERVMVCSNLSFGSDITISKKHTAKVEDTFHGEVIKAAMALQKYVTVSQDRIKRLRDLAVTELEADSLLLRSYEKGLIGARMLTPVINEWRKPSYPEFEARNRWSMVNAYTHVMKERFQSVPFQAASETQAFQQFLAV